MYSLHFDTLGIPQGNVVYLVYHCTHFYFVGDPGTGVCNLSVGLFLLPVDCEPFFVSNNLVCCPLPLFGWYICDRGLFRKGCLLPIVVKTTLDFCLLLAVFTRSVSNFSPNNDFHFQKSPFFFFFFLFQNIKTPSERNIIVGLA